MGEEGEGGGVGDGRQRPRHGGGGPHRRARRDARHLRHQARGRRALDAGHRLGKRGEIRDPALAGLVRADHPALPLPPLLALPLPHLPVLGVRHHSRGPSALGSQSLQGMTQLLYAEANQRRNYCVARDSQFNFPAKSPLDWNGPIVQRADTATEF